ncbi:MAG: amidohydrolase family protein [Phycisphaerae bacterium]
MIIDCHTFIWESPEQLGPNGTSLLQQPVILGDRRVRLLPKADIATHFAASEPVDYCFVLAFTSRHLNAQIPNRFIAEYCREHPSQMIGFAGVDPTEPGAANQIKAFRSESWVGGITLSPAAQDFHPSDTRAFEVYETASKLKLPVVFTNGPVLTPQTRLEYARPILLDEVARTFPDLRLVIAHCGYPWVDETLTLLAKHQHVYADVAGLLHRPWLGYDAIVRAYQMGVLNKLLFGSDFPFATAAECIEAVYAINQTAQGTPLPLVPRSDLRRMVERDALSLLGINTPGSRLTATLPKARRVPKTGG